MKFIYTLFIIFFLPVFTNAQTINVGGQCMVGTITLNKIADINGRPAYQGNGTVDGFAGVTVSIYWLTPDNLWVLDYDGQPYFQNSCNLSAPPATGGSCPWAVVSGTTCTGASQLAITGSGALPVELISFTAKTNNKQVELNWKTALELNNKGFEIQRSKDAVRWEVIGFVQGAVNSSIVTNYTYYDIAPFDGKNYYRLVQYDLNDNRTYSFTVNVELTKTAVYTLSRNPGNGVYQLIINSSSPVEASMLDLSGRRILNKTVGAGVHQLDISKYASGIYLLQIRKGTEIFTEKLIKQ